MPTFDTTPRCGRPPLASVQARIQRCLGRGVLATTPVRRPFVSSGRAVVMMKPSKHRYADHDRWIGGRLSAVAVGMRLLLMSTMKNEKMGRNQTSHACKNSQAQTVWLRRNVEQLCP